MDSPDLTSGGNFGNSTFPGTVHWCMQICHNTFCQSAGGHLKMLIYSIFYWKCRFEMAVMCLILQETPLKISMWIFHFQVQDEKLWNGPSLDWIIFWMSFLSSVSKVIWMEPRNGLDIWGKFWKFYFSRYQSIDACKFAINTFANQLRAIWRC